ncbi:UspA domain-containing protein [Caballeronia terrestris]|uniref:UspA domain-containing protein n=1 Tax=Caballeronia terrestris TaxID=1226301 RepID=A0A158KNH7_9BURK|nr:universal stress protein [Caballeronia terrestris]SAL82692.1 UspA domain-containing protein [Caballeronia terrestris]
MYRRILAAIDGSETSIRALDEALRLARENHAELRPLYTVDAPLMAYEAPGYDPSILRDAMLSEGTRVTNDALGRMHRDNVRGVAQVAEADLYGDGIAQRILLVATEMNADLVVMGTHGRRGFQRLVLGSVAERFVRMACCPVLLIPAEHAAAGSSPGQDAAAPVAEPV